MILVVDMNWKRDSMALGEFVLPIVSAIKPLEECVVKHFSDINPQELKDYSKIVLSGTALKDHATLNQTEKFQWLKFCEPPVLGICAGMQTIGLVFEEPLTPCLQVGMIEVETLKANPLFEGNFRAYALHNFSVAPSKTFSVLAKSTKCVQAIKHRQKDIYGVLFHPEVRNIEILQRFARMEK
jgi:GMP synthase-like glutamine amidotransferase